MKIKAYSLRTLSLVLLLAYIEDFKRAVAENLEAQEQALTAEFDAAYDAILKQRAMTQTLYAEQIEVADADADRAWNGLNYQAKASALHFDVEIQAAGETVLEVIDEFDNPTRLAYAKEYEILGELLTKLRALDADVLQKSGCAVWVEMLDARREAFLALRAEKNTAKSMVENGAVKKLRIALEDAYRTLIDRLNGLVSLRPTDGHKALVDKVNQLITDRRALQKAEATRKKKAAEDANAAAAAAANEDATAPEA